MNKDNPQIEYNNYIVTFLDLLGQKEVFKSLEKFQVIEISEEFERAIKAVHAGSTHNVKTMRESLISFTKDIASKRPVPASIPQEKTEVFEEMRKLTLKYKTFSDCMQFYVSLKTDRLFINLRLRYKTLWNR
jgi:hypothetical protein